MSEKTVNDAKTGDVVSLYGTSWKVIGATGTPGALLVVCLGSPHAEDFKMEDPVKALVGAWHEQGPVEWAPDTIAAVESFARHLIDTGRIRSGG